MKILLVEDDDAHACIVETALRASNDIAVDLVHERDGADAVERLQRCADGTDPGFDLILLDLKLPRLDGHEVLRRIKAEPKLRQTPVVVLTTSVSTTDLRRAYGSHVNSYLVKPVEFDEFRRMIEDLKTYWGRWNQRPAGVDTSPPLPTP